MKYSVLWVSVYNGFFYLVLYVTVIGIFTLDVGIINNGYYNSHLRLTINFTGTC